MPKRGGNKRKNKSGAGPSKGVRFCAEEGEQYAVITKVYGGPNCQAVCQDGKLRMCVIRSKFRWRNKSHNRISAGTWVMVGVRDWETAAKGEQKCDVLEVYADTDVTQLRGSSNLDLRALEQATQAARPGESSEVTDRRQQPTEVLFTEETEEGSVEEARKVVASMRAAPAATFGEEEDEIDMDSI